MLTYLLEKLQKIKDDRGLYCSQMEQTQMEQTQIEKEKEKEKPRLPTVYDFICKNSRK